MYQITQFDPTSAPSGTFNAQFPGGRGKMHIKNASAVDLSFAVNNSVDQTMIVQAGEPRTMPVCQTLAPITWQQVNKLNTNTKQISSVVYVEGYQWNEPVPDSQALARHVNPTNLGFSVSNNFSIGVAGNHYILLIFNPKNSGVNATLYEAAYTLFFTSTVATAGFQIELGYGNADPGLTSKTANNHQINGVASLVTAESSLLAGQATFSGFTLGALKFTQAQQNTALNQAYNFLSTVDQVEVPPGYCCGIDMQQLPLNSFGTVYLSWTETAV